MSVNQPLVLVALGLGRRPRCGSRFRYGLRSPTPYAQTIGRAQPRPPTRTILYYRDPSGAPLWSASPKKDARGRDYLPVYDDGGGLVRTAAELRLLPSGSRKILYYRNPMGLPDISPVPKKDSMGMDYIPVYEGEDAERRQDGQGQPRARFSAAACAAKSSEARVLVRPVRGVGTVTIRRAPPHRRHRALRRLCRGPVRQHHRAVRQGGPAAVPGVQPGDPACPDRSDHRDWRAKPRRSAGSAYRRSKAPCSGCATLAFRRAASRRFERKGVNPRTIDWLSPATRDGDRQAHRQRPAGHAGRRALPHRRPVARVGDRRSLRSRPRRDQARHACRGHLTGLSRASRSTGASPSSIPSCVRRRAPRGCGSSCPIPTAG